MGCPLFPKAYEKLVNEDIEWLKENTSDTLERKHIISIMKHSVREYNVRGYMEDMRHEGPHYNSNKETV